VVVWAEFFFFCQFGGGGGKRDQSLACVPCLLQSPLYAPSPLLSATAFYHRDKSLPTAHFGAAARMLISSAGYPNGLAGYKAKAQELLRASAMGDNPFEGMSPEIPLGCKLHFGDADYEKFEEGGLEVMQHVGFVLVAGGESDFVLFNGRSRCNRHLCHPHPLCFGATLF
jgi:hypothetical protein